MSNDTTSLPHLLEQAEADYLFDRAASLMTLQGNPYGAATHQDNGLQSFLVAATQSPMNNRICGFDIGDNSLPNNAIAQFSQAGATAHIPIIGTPKAIKSRAEALGMHALRGWTQSQFHANLTDLPIAKTDVQTRQLTPDDLTAFVAIHSGAFRYSGTNVDITLAMMRGLLAGGRAEAFAIDDAGTPIAIGLIYFATNQTGYLATAATTQTARKHGAHTALITRRIEAARQHGCTRISSTAIASSQSARNLKRAGLTPSHVQTLLVLD